MKLKFKRAKKALMRSFRTNRFSRRRLAIFIIIFAIIGGYLLLRSFASTIYYISATGSDSNPCTQASPCKTFQHAYQVAQGGDTIAVNGGYYPADYPAEGALNSAPSAG